MKIHRRRHRRNEDGASAIEYALLGTMIAVVIFAVVVIFGTQVGQLYVINW
jgi:Flp pilus assembly pilin Flp